MIETRHLTKMLQKALTSQIKGRKLKIKTKNQRQTTTHYTHTLDAYTFIKGWITSIQIWKGQKRGINLFQLCFHV